ncbi:MAG: corrinoid protein-associated methyltransferase CpaM [Candidatus Aminicenantales bacterium]
MKKKIGPVLTLMRLFEFSPRRYDRRIRLLTGGRLDRVYDWLTELIQEGDLVLDIGCGTGALALRAARKGGRVKALDIHPDMLRTAQNRARDAGLSRRITFVEMGVAELDREKSGHYDGVMCGLSLSELTREEQAFTLRHVHRVLKPGGYFLVADEARPSGLLGRWSTAIVRGFLKALVFLLSGTTTRPLRGFLDELTAAGFRPTRVRFHRGLNLLAVSAEKIPGVSG